MHIAIVGGGIGGLTLGLMLHRRGIESTVLESAAEVKPLGVGINALPHAIRELAGLDLLPALDAVGVRTRRLTYANHLGQTIWSEPRGTFGGHEWPQSPFTADGCTACCGRPRKRRSAATLCGRTHA